MVSSKKRDLGKDICKNSIFFIIFVAQIVTRLFLTKFLSFKKVLSLKDDNQASSFNLEIEPQEYFEIFLSGSQSSQSQILFFEIFSIDCR